MRYYALLRLVQIIPVLIGVLTITFVISHVIPGDPVRLMAGKLAGEDVWQVLRKEYGLDKPLYEQYINYIAGFFLRGDLGRSLRTRQPVMSDLADYFPASFELVTMSMLVSVLVAIPIGVVSATRKDKLIDHGSRLFALSGVAMPAFWLAILLQLILGYGLHLLPISGRIDMALAPKPITGSYLVDTLLERDFSAFWNALQHMLMPVMVLSFGSLSVITRMVRSSMLEVLGQDYVRTARAYGLADRRVVYGYALKNAMIPAMTHIGMSYGTLFGYTVLVETVFDYPGVGLYITNAILYLDFPAIIGATILLSLVVVVANLAVDFVYCLLDPRIRYA